MSIQAVAWVLENSEATYAERLVLIAIANHVGATGWAWPAVPQIAREAGVADSTVYRVVTALEESGELTVKHRPGRPNLYGLTALLKGSQIERGGGSQIERDPSHLRAKPLSDWDPNHKEPSKNRGEVASQIQEPSRCVSCNKLEFDCLCDRGPLIQGLGRRDPQPDQEAVNQ